MSQRIEKLKSILLDRAATNEKKSQAAVGLIAAGVSPSVVKSWARLGATQTGVDDRTRIEQLKWILSQPSTASARRKEVIDELLQRGISAAVIKEWARRRFK